MIRVKKYIVLISILLLLPFVLVAQDNWEKPAGGIKDARVVIEKDKIINLRPVSRRFKTIQIDIPKAKPLGLQYQLKEAIDSLPSLQVIVRPKTMKDQPLEKFYGSTIKAGYGNYNTPYVLLDLATKRNDVYSLNGYFNHYSSGKGPVLGDFSAVGLTNVGGAGNYFMNNFTLYSNVDYNYHSYTIYGYDPEAINNLAIDPGILKQKLNTVAFNIGLADNNPKNDVDQSLNMGVNYLQNNHDVSEFLFSGIYRLAYNLDKDWQLNIKADYTGFLQNGLKINNLSRSYAQLKPLIVYTLDKFHFTGGINAFYNNDPLTKLNKEKQFNIYPVAGIDYAISDHHTASLLVDGKVEKISLNSLIEENPYITPSTQANNNIDKIAVAISLKGKLANKIGYDLSYQYKQYNRIMFYRNNTLDSGRFNVIYDGPGTSLNRVKFVLNYIFNDNLNFGGGLVYYNYSTVTLAAPLHKPKMSVNFNSNFILLDKLYGHITYFMLQGIQAETSTGQTTTLDTIHDLNLGLRMALTERAGLFVDLYNVLGNNYQLYNNYPVKGFQVIAGVSFRF